MYFTENADFSTLVVLKRFTPFRPFVDPLEVGRKWGVSNRNRIL